MAKLWHQTTVFGGDLPLNEPLRFSTVDTILDGFSNEKLKTDLDSLTNALKAIGVAHSKQPATQRATEISVAHVRSLEKDKDRLAPAPTETEAS